MLPTQRVSNPQPPDHQSEVHPTEPPRLAVLYTINVDKVLFNQNYFLFFLLVVGTLLLMDTHIISFTGEIKEIFI